MSELREPFGAPREAVEHDAAEASPRVPVLITEQQVLFATAAAVPLRPARTSRRWTEAVRAPLAAAFVTSLAYFLWYLLPLLTGRSDD